MRRIESHEAENRVAREPCFELSATPEGREIKETLEREYQRRLAILDEALQDLKLPKESVAVFPAVLDRTDFGYNTDLDVIFFGSNEQSRLLHNRLYEKGEFFAGVDCIGQERLRDIKNSMPEFYEFLMLRRGKIPINDSTKTSEPLEKSGEYFLKQSELLEAKIRTLLGAQDKVRLKEHRLAIGRQFIEESAKKVNIVATAFSGSMMENMERFGINSDLDIDFIIDSADSKAEADTGADARDWIFLYLRWKYTQEYGIRVDTFPTELKNLREMASNDNDMADFYQRYFGVDLLDTQANR